MTRDQANMLLRKASCWSVRRSLRVYTFTAIRQVTHFGYEEIEEDEKQARSKYSNDVTY